LQDRQGELEADGQRSEHVAFGSAEVHAQDRPIAAGMEYGQVHFERGDVLMNRLDKIKAWWNSPPTTTTCIVVVILVAVFYALLVVFAFPAHAAIHTDRPTQETAPVASKIEPACLQSTTIMRWLRDDKGKWHTLIFLGREEPCHL
jgi:hypothetical protein